MAANMSLASLCLIWSIFFISLTSTEPRRSGTTFKEVLDQKEQREGRLFPVFQIVRFSNGACVGSGGRNGTCYTASECTSRGGTNSGSCASGYGVCCSFDRGCGSTSNENCTYFSSTNAPTSGSCSLTVCPCSSNVCQLRLDFNMFVISGPSTATDLVGFALFDQLVANNGRPVCNNGRCLTDTFSVTNPSGSAPPVICGTNTGDHMYVDASANCNDLVFQLGAAGVGTALATRNWNIKVTQIDCNSNIIAPSGCTQYFFGSNTGMVRTFNYAGGNHLSNQDQSICVRREGANCRICWTQAAAIDFQVSGPGPLGAKLNSKGVNLPSECCNYGDSGKKSQGFDCVQIPGAVMAGMNVFVNSRICGRNLVTVNNNMVAVTVCSTQQPFMINFNSDTFENQNECTTAADPGFQLTYFMDSMNC